MNLDLEAGIGTGMKAFEAHALQLAIGRLNAASILAQVILVRPVMGTHVLLANRNQANPRLKQDASFFKQLIVALVGIHARSCGQFDGQVMNGRQVMKSPRQQVEGHWQALRGANQVESPPKELLLLGSAVAAILTPSHLAAARGPYPLADRHRQTVDDKHLSGSKRVAQDRQ